MANRPVGSPDKGPARHLFRSYGASLTTNHPAPSRSAFSGDVEFSDSTSPSKLQECGRKKITDLPRARVASRRVSSG